MEQLQLFNLERFIINEIKKKCYLCHHGLNPFRTEDGIGVNYWHVLDEITFEACQASNYIKQLNSE